MIRSIIDILVLEDFYGVSENLDIAKGKYQYPATIKKSIKLLKRIWKSKI